MHRVSVDPLGPGRPPSDRAPRPRATPVEHVLALQRGAGNRAVSAHLGRRSLQRVLDTDFPLAGKPTKAERETCEAFAAIVSRFVDQAHLDLLGGNIKNWEKGPKLAAFLKLLMDGKRTAVVHAGNVIEERVYGLMQAAKLPAPWVPQFSAGMGGASRPDIVIKLDSGKEGLIDITSQRGHILGKAGSWTTSQNYVYVAEAWFPSVFADHLPSIRGAIQAGGLDKAAVVKMQADILEQRRHRAEAAKAEQAEARQIYGSYASFSEFARELFDGNKTEASAWMREHGLGGYKGVTKKKGPRKLSEEGRTKRRRDALKKRQRIKTEERAKAQAEGRKEEREKAAQAKREAALGKHKDADASEELEDEESLGEEEEDEEHDEEDEVDAIVE